MVLTVDNVSAKCVMTFAAQYQGRPERVRARSEKIVSGPAARSGRQGEK
jgi:hypothetical protein